MTTPPHSQEHNIHEHVGEGWPSRLVYTIHAFHALTCSIPHVHVLTLHLPAYLRSKLSAEVVHDVDGRLIQHAAEHLHAVQCNGADDSWGRGEGGGGITGTASQSSATRTLLDTTETTTEQKPTPDKSPYTQGWHTFVQGQPRSPFHREELHPPFGPLIGEMLLCNLLTRLTQASDEKRGRGGEGRGGVKSRGVWTINVSHTSWWQGYKVQQMNIGEGSITYYMYADLPEGSKRSISIGYTVPYSAALLTISEPSMTWPTPWITNTRCLTGGTLSLSFALSLYPRTSLVAP